MLNKTKRAGEMASAVPADEQVWTPVPTSGSYQPLVIPAPEDLMSSSSPCRHSHTCGTHRNTNKNRNKSFKNKAGVVVHTCNPSTAQAETAGPWGSGTGQPSRLGELQSCERFRLKTQRWTVPNGWYLRLSSDLHTHRPAHFSEGGDSQLYSIVELV